MRTEGRLESLHCLAAASCLWLIGCDVEREDIATGFPVLPVEPRPDQAASSGERDGGPDPCTDGTFSLGCAEFTIYVREDNLIDKLLAGATISVSVDDHLFEAQSDEQGRASIALPRARSLWMRASAEQHWATEVQLAVDGNDPGTILSIAIMSENFVSAYYSLFNMDPDLSYSTLYVTFFPGFAGSGIDVGRPTGGKVVRAEDSMAIVLSPTLLNDTPSEVMVLLNVHAGPLTLMPAVPDGDCEPVVPALAYEAKPKTVTFFNLVCFRE